MEDWQHNKYCLIGGIICEHYGPRKFCSANDKEYPEFIANFEVCPWPSQKKPMKGDSSEWICPDLDKYK